MRLPDIATTANANLRRSPLRTFLTMLSIGIGTFTLALSLGLGQGVRAYLASQIGQYEDVNLYRVTKEGAEGFSPGFGSGEPREYREDRAQNVSDISQLLLNEQDLAKIRAANGVGQIRVPYGITFRYVTAHNGTRYEAPADQIFPEIPVTLVAGQLPVENDLTGIAISRKFMIPVLGVQSSEQAIGKPVTLTYVTTAGEERQLSLTVRAVYEPTLFEAGFKISESLSAQVAEAQRVSPVPTYFAVFVTKTDTVTDADLRAAIKSAGYQAGSFADLNRTLNNFITAVQVALAGFSGIAILAAVVGVVNTLFMAVLERTREIGLYRALGSKQRTIFGLFAVEAGLIGFWGSVFGLIVAFGAQYALNTVASRTFLKGIEGFQLLALTPALVGGIIAAMALVTLIAGLIPARKAARLDPIEALRTE